MTGAEIQAIIEASAKSNVQEIDLPGLRLKFGDRGPAKPPEATPEPPETTQATGAAPPEQRKLTEEELLQLEDDVKSERLALMLIEDPAQYEKLATSGQLVDLVETEDGGEAYP